MASLYNEKAILDLENEINITFNRKELLQKAITHKSFPNENPKLNLNDNERLEFLGDSVLSLTISTHIFKKFPDYPEGELAKMRAVLVSEHTLAKKARELNIGDYLFLGRGEELTGGRERKSILADTMEAIFGAIYLDKNFEIAFNFILSIFKSEIDNVEQGKHIRDYKTMLQEVIQQNENEPPEYYVVDEQGPDHNKTFVVKVKCSTKFLGLGSGSSKKEAEQRAAKVALEKLNEI